jgi:hypothetical protein
MTKLKYSKKMIKRKNKIVWRVIEKPSNAIVGEYFFEEDAKDIVNFQNKNQVWAINGGIPDFLKVRR